MKSDWGRFLPSFLFVSFHIVLEMSHYCGQIPGDFRNRTWWAGEGVLSLRLSRR